MVVPINLEVTISNLEPQDPYFASIKKRCGGKESLFSDDLLFFTTIFDKDAVLEKLQTQVVSR